MLHVLLKLVLVLLRKNSGKPSSPAQTSENKGCLAARDDGKCSRSRAPDLTTKIGELRQEHLFNAKY